MHFPDDQHWLQVRDWLKQQAQPLDVILAPNEFLEFFPGVYHYAVANAVPVESYQYILFHKGMLNGIEAAVKRYAVLQLHPILANEVFVLYAKTPATETPLLVTEHLQSFLRQVEVEIQQEPLAVAKFNSKSNSAAVITTYNRPWCLERSLPQILQLGIPVVIVDDASSPAYLQENQAIAERYQVPLLHLPDHREQSSAINVGVSYWLADSDITWISCFRDYVTVKPEALNTLGQVQDAELRPLLAGYDDADHPTLATETIAGQTVLLKRSMSGLHFHAHRSYWTNILPIPTPYLNHPKPHQAVFEGAGVDEDWWITAWSPHSITKRGGYVVCIPDLVAQFDPSPESKTYPAVAAITPTAAVAAKAQTLEGVKVLVDGYNLQLTKGTGIKTYGLSLLEALDQLQANVDVLLSRGGYRNNAILDEVLFFDNPIERPDLLMLSKWVLKSLSPFYRAKRRQSFAGLVVKQGKYTDDFLKYATSFSLPQCYDLANGLYSRLKLTTQITIAENIDLWHATYPLPLNVRGAKKITTVHDLIPLRLPYATLDSKKVFYNNIKDSLRDSAVTITVSENSKQDLLTYYDADPDRIIVTYQPIALKPLDAAPEEVSLFLRRYGLSYQNYILFVGAIEPKKNVGRLIDAYSTVDTDMPLVIVGKKGWLWEDELGKAQFLGDDKSESKKVKLLEYISVESLRYIYSGAYCLVFPSLYEGFGLPPVEAMNFGCPVITSNTSCLPEICGDAALYVDPYSIRDIKDQLETLLGDAALRQQLVQAGKLRAKAFSMENYVKRLHKAYRQALDS
jgi:glycosyltransferase involved in cell wall biosynthesis